MKTAFMFPGQGSQAVGMGRELYDSNRAAKAVFDEIEAAVPGLLDVMWNGTAEDLAKSENSQPAIFATSQAMWQSSEFRVQSSDSALVFGHSLGEYSALCAAGAISTADAARLLRRRGELMQSAVPAGVGAMAAIIGAGWSIDDAQSICDEANSKLGVVSVANDNGIGQVVISGAREAVEKAVELALAKGAKLAKVLPISVPAHSAMMGPMVAEFRAAVDAISWSAPKLPFISNKTADIMSDLAEIKDALVYQLTHGVRFRECVLRAANLGVTDFIEIGPGNVLSGIVKRIIV